MRLSPPVPVACPQCAHVSVDQVPASGNTMGAAWWSDGVLRGPMWPRASELLRCRACGALVWRSELRRDGIDAPAPSAGRLSLVEPTPAQIWAALDEGLVTDAEQAKRMQLQAWQRANDTLCWQQGAQAAAALPSEVPGGAPPHRLRLLNAALHGVDANELLRKAEVLRQLGRFEPALHTLQQVHSPAHAEWVQHLRALCEAGERQLARMPLAC